MDDSQNSDLFSNSDDYLCKSPGVKMDTTSYEALLSNLKISLSKNSKEEVTRQTFSSYFTDILEDSATCVSQSLELIKSQVTESDVLLTKVQAYMEDTINLLQLLSNFIRGVIEEITLSCCNMKSFSTTTGRIILAVFTHCKDSETVYGIHLKSVEKQLKDLFKTCHDLQLTYLMILEKHYVFNLAKYEELAVLVDALNINLKIGEIVQSLDVKTMAEQWKAFSVICEKYSSNLRDEHIFQDSMKILCSMIENNLKSAIESDEDEKVTLRCLKVASFTIKILLKLCIIFKNSSCNNYDRLIELLIYIYLNSCPYLEIKLQKPPQFYSQLTVNISTPIEALVKELLSDEVFLNSVLKFDITTIHKEDKILGYMLLTISLIRAVVEKNEEVNIDKHQFIQCVFSLLAYGHIWFNIGLKLKAETKSDIETNGVFEYLLINTLALSCTCNNNEVNYLEKTMYETIMGLDCYSALFSANLWSLLARLSPRQYTLNQLQFLCKSYQKLEENNLFSKSPQEVHLSYTISKLFNAINDEDKIKIYKQLNLENDRNMSLWYCLGIFNLPNNVQYSAQRIVKEKLCSRLENAFSSGIPSKEDMDSLINLLKMASTCSFDSISEDLENLLTKAWLKLCPVNNNFVIRRGNLGVEVVWYLDFIEALVLLTGSVMDGFQHGSNLIKVLHIASSLIEKGNTEVKLVLTDLINIISSLHHKKEEHKTLADSLLTESFKNLLKGDEIVKNKFLNKILSTNQNETMKIINRIKSEDDSLRQIFENTDRNILHVQRKLESTVHMRYSHKCLEPQIIEINSSGTSIQKSESNNFDFADIDTLFEVESDSEPACKKVKLDVNIEEIISRLEQDVSSLCNVKENLKEYSSRIRNVCDKLNSLIC